jgi:hypothetical protein
MAKTRKEQKDKQRSTEHYPETRNWATRTYKKTKKNKLGWTQVLRKWKQFLLH